MARTFIGVWSLSLLQIIIVGNLQVLPANAQYGFSLPFLYAIAFLTFYLPCLNLTKTLGIHYPKTGGAIIWVEHALGRRSAFFASSLLWFSNLVWYPSVFALIAANIAYLFDGALAQHRGFVLSVSLMLFWTITLLNCLGINLSIRFSTLCSIVGIIFPTLLLILCGSLWIANGNVSAINLQQTPLIPNLSSWSNLNYLIAVIISLFGIEVAAVHAGNIKSPRTEFPRSLLISTVLIFLLLIGAEVSIAMIVPASQLNVETGLLDAFVMVLQKLHWEKSLQLILLLILFGNLGSITAWMLGSTRSMYVACQTNHVLPILQITNRYDAPIGVLVFEALIFTLACITFLIFPAIVETFWILLVLASQITLIYYGFLFISGIKLGCNKLLMCIGLITSTLVFLLGFIAPGDLSRHDQRIFDFMLVIGIITALILPSTFLYFGKKT